MSNQQRILEVQLLARARTSVAEARLISKSLNGYKFSDQTLAWVWAKVQSASSKREPVKLPSLLAQIGTEPLPAHEPLKEVLAEIWSSPSSGAPLTDCETLLRYQRHSNLAKGMERGVRALTSGRLDEASEVLARTSSEDRTAESDLQFSSLFDFEAWDAPNPTSGFIPTGIKTYDEVCAGGANRQDLGVVFGNTNMGKSILMTNIGFAAVKHGFRVLHVDTENGLDVVRWRYIARILRKPTNTLLRRQGRGVEGFREWATKHEKRFNDSIRICSIGVDQVPLEELDARIFSEIDDGWTPDVIIGDTPDHCPLKTPQENPGMIARLQYGKCKSIAQRANAVFWAVTQAKAESEGKIATNKNVAWGYDKARLATHVLTINPGLDDHGNPMSERAMGGSRSLFVAKARNAVARFVLPLLTDFACAYVTEDVEGHTQHAEGAE